MSFPTIVTHVSTSSDGPERYRFAVSVARKYGSHLVGLASTGLPRDLYLADGGELGPVVLSYLGMIEQEAKKAIAQFRAVVDQSGIASHETVTVEEEAGVALSLRACYSDLVILGQFHPEEPDRFIRADVPEYVVLHSPRPVLVLPHAMLVSTVGRRVMIAWDGGVAAARAIASALPFLRDASAVQVVICTSPVQTDAYGELPGADIGLYLSRHDIAVEVSVEHVERSTMVGGALLSHAADWGADMMVMGCYGHTRFRELLLGGVTRELLRSMTIPVLMQH